MCAVNVNKPTCLSLPWFASTSRLKFGTSLAIQLDFQLVSKLITAVHILIVCLLDHWEMNTANSSNTTKIIRQTSEAIFKSHKRILKILKLQSTRLLLVFFARSIGFFPLLTQINHSKFCLQTKIVDRVQKTVIIKRISQD